ncbi:MAG TPA: hypothetical protein VMC80_02575 [Patescibacteria group bacterium]|nr:hypothetical protein [Patescibacteria group bacterium]
MVGVGIFEPLFIGGIGVELIYSFIIIVCSLMIYHATREMYELTSYKGIKYFRQAFLFFAIAFFFRYSIRFFLVLLGINGLREISPVPFGILTSFVFLYLSSMTVFCLLYSVMWKKWNHDKIRIYVFNIAAFAIALIGTVFSSIGTYLILNVILLAFVLISLLVAHRDRKKRGGLFIIYTLLFIFWTLNVIDILIPQFLELYQMVIYLASVFLFMLILYKVLKKTGD